MARAPGVRVRGRRWRGLVALLAPVAASYPLAGMVLPSHTPRLETQIAWFVQDLGGVPPTLPARSAQFLWGHSALTDLPQTLWFLVSASAPAAPGNDLLRQAHIDPWLVPLLIALAAACWGLRKTPVRLVALVMTCLPFGLALHGAATGQAYPRHLAMAWPFAPVVLGIGLATVIRVPPAVLGGLAMVAVVGLKALPGRGVINQRPDIDALFAVHPDADPAVVARFEFNDPVCRAALQADLDAGHPWGSRLYRRWPPLQ